MHISLIQRVLFKQSCLLTIYFLYFTPVRAASRSCLLDRNTLYIAVHSSVKFIQICSSAFTLSIWRRFLSSLHAVVIIEKTLSVWALLHGIENMYAATFFRFGSGTSALLNSFRYRSSLWASSISGELKTASSPILLVQAIHVDVLQVAGLDSNTDLFKGHIT